MYTSFHNQKNLKKKVSGIIFNLPPKTCYFPIKMEEKRRFHTLDALRFFAFLKVYLLHIPLQGNFPIFSFLKSGGGIGVSFFFVLSGFLISYLLIFEKIQTNKINLKKFFIRRSLRIYPLFFFLVILGFMLPYGFKEQFGFHMIGGGYDLDWRYSFTFLENYKMLMEDNFPKTTPLSVFWSLCIEEHFYITWMLILFFIPQKRILQFLVACILISWSARYLDPILWNNHMIQQNDLFTNLDYFAVGGILGWQVATNYDRLVSFIQNISLQKKYLFIFFVIGMVIFQGQLFPSGNFYLSILRPTIFAIAFTLLIAIFIPQNSSIKIKGNHPISYLGKISFGLYVYHLIFIHVLFQYFLKHEIFLDNWWTVSFFIFATFGASVLVSVLSFHFLEKPFLLLRDNFSKS